jgi:formate hydrogenlyase transcriptional activator
MRAQPIPESVQESVLAIDAVPALAWCSLVNGHTERVNQRWQDYTGMSQEQARGIGWESALHPEDLPVLIQKWHASLASGLSSECEARLRRFNGEYHWFLFRVEPWHDLSGKITRWYGINIDIDSLKIAQANVVAKERDLHRIPDAISTAIIVQDAAGVPIYANRVVLEYTGTTMEDVLAPNSRERIFHPEDYSRVREQRLLALQRGEPFEIEQRARRHDGEYRWFLIQYRPFRDEDGRLIRWYATGTDIHERKLAEERIQSEMLALRDDIVSASMFEEVVGSSPAIRSVLADLSKVARTDSTVLILGETGTGKELIARAIHERSPRSSRAFIRVNCAAIPQALIASELFGHERGAFTGALQRRLGRFELAHGGTIFLDEIGELPAETQVALLRVLQEREFERVGGAKTVAVDVRVIAATNRDLPKAVAQGIFREDLFYRLNVIPLEVPPLRERTGDVRLLAEYFVSRYAEKTGKAIRHISKSSLALLESYRWPGNIRELQNVIERAVILCDGDTLSVEKAWISDRSIESAAAFPESDSERQEIELALRATSGRISGPAGAAAKLNLPRQTLESKIRRLGIEPHRFKTARKL